MAIFNHGVLQQIAAPRQVYERPANRFVAEFLGNINVLPLADVTKTPDGAQALFEGQVLRVPADAGAPSTTLAVRPEHMSLRLTAPDAGNAIKATVCDLTYLGAETQLSLMTVGAVPLTISMPTTAIPQDLTAGASVWAAWAADQGIFL